MTAAEITNKDQQVSVLVVDDSAVFRRFISDIFEDNDQIRLCGEAENGIDALDAMLKSKPDVIMMDMEMPLMDGMTALQHLMIHRPVPTIMFSSITSEGTHRAFDALKNGAVEFLSKDFIFQEKSIDEQREKVVQKVLKAARMRVLQVEPSPLFAEYGIPAPMTDKRVVFCEDCGGQNVLELPVVAHPLCCHCGDPLMLDGMQGYEKESFITVMGGGEGSIRNLLNIVPRLKPEGVGSVIIVLHTNNEQMASLAQYLDAVSRMKVLRIQEGMGLEQNCCYLASAAEYICLRPQANQFFFQKVKTTDSEVGSIDLTMASVASLFKRDTAGILLSSHALDGLRGLATVKKNGGRQLVLNLSDCLARRLVEKALQNGDPEVVGSEDLLARKINSLHRKISRSG